MIPLINYIHSNTGALFAVKMKGIYRYLHLVSDAYHELKWKFNQIQFTKLFNKSNEQKMSIICHVDYWYSSYSSYPSKCFHFGIVWFTQEFFWFWYSWGLLWVFCSRSALYSYFQALFTFHTMTYLTRCWWIWGMCVMQPLTAQILVYVHVQHLRKFFHLNRLKFLLV